MMNGAMLLLATAALSTGLLTGHAWADPPAAPQVASPAAVELTSMRLTDRVHVLHGGPDGNVLVLTGTDGLLLVDGQAADKLGAVQEAVSRLSDAPVRFVVNTHYHPDHVGANAAYAEQGATVVSHVHAREDMSRRSVVEEMGWTLEPAPREAWPGLTYRSRMELHLDGETVVLEHLPAAHTGGDTLVHLRDANVLHAGDVYEVEAYPFLDIWHGGTLEGMVAAVDRMLEIAGPGTQVVPGHGPVSTRADLVDYRSMLSTLRERIEAAVAAGQSLDEFLATDPTADFSERRGSQAGAVRLATIAFMGQAAAREAAPQGADVGTYGR
jgi:glyoxylase-like metal-dependent hydrolase (beta-lactamase superfamily II)